VGHASSETGKRAKYKRAGGDRTTTRSETRYGCFLPDLTGLARRPPVADLRPLYREAGPGAQAWSQLELHPMPLNAFQNTFAGNPLDRASERRIDEAWLAEKLAAEDSLGIALWNGRPLVEKSEGGGLQLAYVRADMAGRLAQEPERLLFMGLWEEAAVFAVVLEGGLDPAGGPLRGLGGFEDLRPVALRLPPAAAPLAATANAATARRMFEGRRRHRHCATCGEQSLVADGGWKRRCPACKAEHFPRTDPVVIMLPYLGDRCMLGRQAAWPAGMFSALAGFLEPGETIEEACARELKEEAGLKTVSVQIGRASCRERV